ncbi:PrsW family intramembrane metalloprotease [Clostridium sp. D2Q-11]|uniref:Protease PrsW n=1 Tax=Anaeromonas frigoriresistens TaxID=2683708 RepID=A0A942UVI0_9FIRM|nr:PrsW family intramembrane metalloprotease [Anaeromonas frigoriresistens]MBS4538270.1 PrsW family intramembrane metalloprotease [Anaeromonas frigoriresistens]
MFIRILIIAITPAISIGLAVYLTDRYDREPISLLAKSFVGGMIIVLPTIIVERLLVRFNIFGGVLGILYTAFIVAGFTEEYFKRYTVLKVAYHKEDFDEKLDGIVYSVFVSLGLATVENIMYLLRFSNFNPYVGLYRGVLSVPAHAVFGVTMGYYLSLAKFSTSETEEKKNIRKALYMPLVLHGIFNFILMLGIPQTTLIFIPYVFYLWKTNQKKLNKYIYESKVNFLDKDNFDN